MKKSKMIRYIICLGIMISYFILQLIYHGLPKIVDILYWIAFILMWGFAIAVIIKEENDKDKEIIESKKLHKNQARMEIGGEMITITFDPQVDEDGNPLEPIEEETLIDSMKKNMKMSNNIVAIVSIIIVFACAYFVKHPFFKYCDLVAVLILTFTYGFDYWFLCCRKR